MTDRAAAALAADLDARGWAEQAAGRPEVAQAWWEAARLIRALADDDAPERILHL